MEQRLSDEKTALDATQQKYDKLVEQGRKYTNLVKNYQLECQKNEELAAERSEAGETPLG